MIARVTYSDNLILIYRRMIIEGAGVDKDTTRRSYRRPNQHRMTIRNFVDHRDMLNTVKNYFPDGPANVRNVVSSFGRLATVPSSEQGTQLIRSMLGEDTTVRFRECPRIANQTNHSLL